MARRFQTTRWTLVLQAGEGDAASEEALSQLCEAYWFPVYGFVRGQGYAEEDAKDLTQSYFAALLDKEFLNGLNPEFGRFRSFLLVSIRNFLSNERDRERAIKRGGAVNQISLDAEAAEQRIAEERHGEMSPERAFEIRWANTIVQRALQRLADDFEQAGQSDRFNVMRGFLTGDGVDKSYAELAERLETTENNVKSMVRRLRKRYGTALRAEVSQTIDSHENVDEELKHLLRTLESR